MIGIFPFNSLCWVMIGTGTPHIGLEEIIHDNVFMVLDFNNCFQCITGLSFEILFIKFQNGNCNFKYDDS